MVVNMRIFSVKGHNILHKSHNLSNSKSQAVTTKQDIVIPRGGAFLPHPTVDYEALVSIVWLRYYRSFQTMPIQCLLATSFGCLAISHWKFPVRVQTLKYWTGSYANHFWFENSFYLVCFFVRMTFSLAKILYEPAQFFAHEQTVF